MSGGSSNIDIQGNVIAYNETNIQLMGRHGAIRNVNVIGNFLLNPRGPFPRGQQVQSWSGRSPNTNITVADNYAYSCNIRDAKEGIVCPKEGAEYIFSEAQEDSINFGYTSNFAVANNRVVGGHSPAGCAIIADKGSTDGTIDGNFLFSIGQCGIGVTGGSNHSLSNNKILSLTAPANVGIYVWNHYGGTCGPIRLRQNISSTLSASSTHCDPGQQSCTFNGYWSSGCEVDASDNLFDIGTHLSGGGPAYRMLIPILLENPAPLIPPKPKNCSAVSPYSTQTSTIPCS